MFLHFGDRHEAASLSYRSRAGITSLVMCVQKPFPMQCEHSVLFGKDSKETKFPEISFTLKASLGLELQELVGLKKKCLYLPYIRLYT